jgi:hypothetical protein
MESVASYIASGVTRRNVVSTADTFHYVFLTQGGRIHNVFLTGDAFDYVSFTQGGRIHNVFFTAFRTSTRGSSHLESAGLSPGSFRVDLTLVPAWLESWWQAADLELPVDRAVAGSSRDE